MQNAISRRNVLIACGSLTAVPLISQAERVPDPLRKRHFVLVHGAWHGGWAWKYVAEHLIRAGHSVTTPTLSGLGEHSHTATTAIDLSTHVEDIVSHIVMEDLSDVVLVGHSYAGMVLPGVLASINERIASAIFFDAFTPKPGQALSDFIPESDKAEQMKHQEKGELAPVPPYDTLAKRFGLEEKKDRDWVAVRLRPQPALTFLSPSEAEIIHEGVSYTYIRCERYSGTAIPMSTRWIENDKRWAIKSLDVHHDAMIIDPLMVSESLLSAV